MSRPADVFVAVDAVYREYAPSFPTSGEMLVTKNEFRRAMLTRAVASNIRKADELWRAMFITGVMRSQEKTPLRGIFMFSEASSLLRSEFSTVKPPAYWGGER